MEYTIYESQGLTILLALCVINNSSTIFGLGPRVGYFFDAGTNAIPFFGGGFGLRLFGDEDDIETGFGFQFGGGILLKYGHLGTFFEGGVQFERYNPDNSDAITGNSIYLNVGLAVLLFSDE